MCGADKPVVLLLPLEPVPGRLGNPLSRSGVFADRIAGDFGPWMDPIEEREAREAADAIASGWTGDHDVFETTGGERACSLDVDLRNC